MGPSPIRPTPDDMLEEATEEEGGESGSSLIHPSTLQTGSDLESYPSEGEEENKVEPGLPANRPLQPIKSLTDDIDDLLASSTNSQEEDVGVANIQSKSSVMEPPQDLDSDSESDSDLASSDEDLPDIGDGYIPTTRTHTTESVVTPRTHTTESMVTPRTHTSESVTTLSHTTESVTTSQSHTTESMTASHSRTTESMTTSHSRTTESMTTPHSCTTESVTTSRSHTTESLTTPRAHTTEPVPTSVSVNTTQPSQPVAAVATPTIDGKIDDALIDSLLNSDSEDEIRPPTKPKLTRLPQATTPAPRPPVLGTSQQDNSLPKAPPKVEKEEEPITSQVSPSTRVRRTLPDIKSKPRSGDGRRSLPITPSSSPKPHPQTTKPIPTQPIVPPEQPVGGASSTPLNLSLARDREASFNASLRDKDYSYHPNYDDSITSESTTNSPLPTTPSKDSLPQVDRHKYDKLFDEKLDVENQKLNLELELRNLRCELENAKRDFQTALGDKQNLKVGERERGRERERERGRRKV